IRSVANSGRHIGASRFVHPDATGAAGTEPCPSGRARLQCATPSRAGTARTLDPPRRRGPRARTPGAIAYVTDQPPILPSLTSLADLRSLTAADLDRLAAEIRETIITTVATTGGHLGSSLGVVELTIALHRLLESPRDRIVWDTGHQAYPHKLLTGRFARFRTLRSLDGVGGFP